MASGILGQNAPLATTNTTVYTVPASTYAIVNVSILNRGAAPAVVRLAVSASGTPTTAEYLEYDASIPPNGVLERTGIAINATKNVVVYSSTGDASCSVYGLETAA